MFDHDECFKNNKFKDTFLCDNGVFLCEHIIQFNESHRVIQSAIHTMSGDQPMR